MTDDSAAEDREVAADAATSSDDGVVADERDDATDVAEAGTDDTDAADTGTDDTDAAETGTDETEAADTDAYDTVAADTGADDTDTDVADPVADDTEEQGTSGNVVDGVGDRDDAVAVAATALRHGDLVVVPTDTVYGVAADAFNPAATSAVFDAKRRQRRFPLPVLIRSPKQLMGLVTVVPETAERLMAAYWPGPLTLVVRADPNLAWELGQNDGTVAVRMPMDDITLDVIRAVGPLATTSANLSGQPAATTVDLARSQLGDTVAVYVDGGRRAETQPSTIVDLTRPEPSILRSGPLPDDEVLAVARGEIESHQASAPRPRHKPVSPGGPAETTPTDADPAGSGGTAADPELASDTPTGPGPEDAPSTTIATAAAGATAAATRDQPADAPDADAPEDDDPDASEDADSEATDGTTADATPAIDGPRHDSVAVDHRASAASTSTSTRRTRRRTGGRVVTAPPEATDRQSDTADATEDTSTPARPRRRARSRPSEPAPTPASEDAAPIDTHRDLEPPPDKTDLAPTRRRSTHHVARDHRAGT